MKRQSTMFETFEEGHATSSPPAGPAKATPWLESVLDWLTKEADCGERFDVSWVSSLPVGFWEKTSLEFCRSTEGGIGRPSCGTWRNSGMGSPTAFVTLSTGEFPSGAVVSSLSDVLETGDVPRKYFLSPKACRGILRRAAKRGRELPPSLRSALEQVAGREKYSGTGSE